MILNSRPTGEHMDDDDYVVQAGIDTSESVVLSHTHDIDTLKEENAYLKQNLKDNVNKLNEALKAVDLMQQLMVGNGQLYESRRIHIGVLNEPTNLSEVPAKVSPPNSTTF